jgi:hypothetical protein
VRRLLVIRTKFRPWSWYSSPPFFQVAARPCLPTALAVRNRLPPCPGDGAGGSGGGVSGPASSSCDSFRLSHRREMSEAGSGVLQQRSCASVDGRTACASSVTSLNTPRPISDGWKKRWSNWSGPIPEPTACKRLAELGPKTVAVLRAETFEKSSALLTRTRRWPTQAWM